MEIIRENLNVKPSEFMIGLEGLNNTESKVFDYFGKKLTIETSPSWTSEDETILDSLISNNTESTDFIELVLNEVVNMNTREFHKKTNKSSLKNEIKHFNYKKKADLLILRVESDWDGSKEQTLIDLIDSLTGSDSVLVRMDVYDQRKKDAWIFYNETRCEIVDNIYKGYLTAQDQGFIQQKMSEVKLHLAWADWKDARAAVERTTAEGVYTEELKQSFYDSINGYIQLNYPEGERD
jgi:hypothetical protein